MKKIIVLIIIPFLLIACKKKDLKIYTLEITSEDIVATRTAADITVQYNYPTKLERVNCYLSLYSDMTDSKHTNATISEKQFKVRFDSLCVNTQYFYYYEYSNGIDIVQTNVKNFCTMDYVLPIVATNDVSGITAITAICGGSVTDNGGLDIIARGFCWNTNQNPTINNNHTSNGTGLGDFTSNITGLNGGTHYYVRSYATNSKGIAYGNQVEFTTYDGHPVVVTNEVSNITPTTAICGGNVTYDGSVTITARGVCWSTNDNPTINDFHTTDGTGLGTFNSSISGLTENTTYYVRAYATNNEGTGYGETKTFTTQHTIIVPVVTTNNVTNVTASTAISGGSVLSEGYGTISAYGVCWSISQNPTIDDMHTTDGAGIGDFVSQIVGLIGNTTYYVRAYATNETGTGYGEEKVFTTLEWLPIVMTNNVSYITATTAMCGGNVTNDNGFNVIEKGVCWSTGENPTITDAHTTDGTGLGEFTSNITGLSAETQYFVRAYATNSNGTSYGEQKTFTTKSDAPIGAINGLFSINNNGDKLYFSKGNLQYQASTGTWRFAEEQYGCAGYDNSYISSTYNGWIDIYGWATSGYNGKYPYMVSTSVYDYGPGENDITGTNYDWGVYNPISNGGNEANLWRTPTYNELMYIFNYRNTVSGIRYAKAIVNNVNGVILLPDDWVNNYYELYNVNNSNASFNSNIISAQQWSTIEQLGAVFFPAAGKRFGTSYGELGETGGYWSATHESDDNAFAIEFGNSYFSIYPCSRDRARSVRLVCDYED